MKIMREPRGERQGAVLLDDAELLRSADQKDAVEINIIGPDHLEHQGRSVHISPATMALNGLLICRREGFAPANKIRDVVGYDASHSSFKEDMDRIKTSLLSLTDRSDLVETTGAMRSKQYQLSHLLDFIDHRPDAAGNPELRK